MILNNNDSSEVNMKKIGLVGGTGPESTLMYYKELNSRIDYLTGGKEMPDIAIGARWHHERFDGRGYRDQLQGMDIPEIARIIGVADAYDAMTSKRSYRDVLAQDIVLGELEKGRKTQFDPEIADVMIHLIKEDRDYQLHE